MRAARRATYRAEIDLLTSRPPRPGAPPTSARLDSHRHRSIPGAIRPDGADRLHPTAYDWAIAAVLGATAVAEAALGTMERPLAALAPTLVAISALPWRRLHPIRVALVVLAAGAASALLHLGTARGDEGLAAGAVAMLIAVYAVCRWVPARHLTGAVAAVAAVVAATAAIDGQAGVLASIAAAALPIGAVLGLALAMRYRARLDEEVVARARLAERNELARELHDVVAHHVSAIAVQAQAARAVVAERPEVAADSLATIEEAASTTLTEMRRMVGILRSDDRRPTIDHHDLRELADEAGPPKVTVSGPTDLTGYSAPVAAALVRIAQEATTNARRHAPGVTFIDITVTHRADAVVIEVVNDGAPRERRGDGFGLIGMQERTEALGGTLTVGPRPAGGWSVAAVLPQETP